jgi:hypothetical protein
MVVGKEIRADSRGAWIKMSRQFAARHAIAPPIRAVVAPIAAIWRAWRRPP